jgi:hypothetical protein
MPKTAGNVNARALTWRRLGGGGAETYQSTDPEYSYTIYERDGLWGCRHHDEHDHTLGVAKSLNQAKVLCERHFKFGTADAREARLLEETGRRFTDAFNSLAEPLPPRGGPRRKR